MDWIQAIVPALISGLVVGLILTVFKNKLEQSVAITKEASYLRERSIIERIDLVDKKASGLERKIDIVSDKVDLINKDMHRHEVKLELLIADNKHMTESISQVRKEVERIMPEDFGKVIKKP